MRRSSSRKADLTFASAVDRMIEEQMLSYGAAIGYYSGDVKTLVDDIGALRPTIFIGVPRVYDRIYAGVIDQINKAGVSSSLPLSIAVHMTHPSMVHQPTWNTLHF